MKEQKLFSLFSSTRDEAPLKVNEDYKKVAAWFLGSKAENVDMFMGLLEKSIREHAELRKNYYPNEQGYIDASIKGSLEFQSMCTILEDKRQELSEKLNDSVPFFSQKYQAHMNADTLMAGNLGYMTAMLYNQNNVATEASPVTSALEKEVGEQLCTLLGYGKENDASVTSWGHITADGTIANIEAMWAARNLKTYPLAIKEMILCNQTSLEKAKAHLTVHVFDGTSRQKKLLVDCSNWQLLNINIDEALELPVEIVKLCPSSENNLDKMLKPHLLATKGIAFYAKKYPEFENMKVFVPVTHHYSWPKSGTLLGIGQDNVIGIKVDKECKMDNSELAKKLEECYTNRHPVLMVVAVIGSTAEGSIDNVAGINAIKDGLSSRGLEFNLHCDAAWGGYLRSMLIYPKDSIDQKRFSSFAALSESHFVPNLPLSEYAVEQYDKLRFADTITVDPHKSGYISYAAGALCYRNGKLKSMITFNASYIQSDADTNMGIYGVEGSKPGATAAAVWLAHQVVPLDRSGYGQILGECSYTAKIYYCYWLTLQGKLCLDEVTPVDTYAFCILPLIQLPSSIVSSNSNILPFESRKDIKDYIIENIIDKDIESIAANERAMMLLQNVGSDVLMNTFMVNFSKNGIMNTDYNLMNQLNKNIFTTFSITKDHDHEQAHKPEYVLMMNTLSSNQYENAFQQVLAEWELEVPENYELNVLVNTILQPWPNTAIFVGEVMKTFTDGVASSLKTLLSKGGL